MKTNPLSGRDVATRLDQKLRELNCRQLAKQTGFQRRKPRKITPKGFLRALCLSTLAGRLSMEHLALMIGCLAQQTVSKQAIAKRLTAAATGFVQQALYTTLSNTADWKRVARKGYFSSFGRVILNDSTCLSLPAPLAKAYPGNGNVTGKSLAVLKIQTFYDLLQDRILTLSLSGFTRNDQAASPDILAVARKGDLVLRDLGYFVLNVFASLGKNGVFFLSRWKYGTHVYSKTGQPVDLWRTLRSRGSFDEWVCLGNDRVPVRLVALPISSSQAAARRRQARQNRDQRCQPARERLGLMNWEIFITNVPASIWSTAAIAEVYGVRWRIEVIFKAWKSGFRLDRLPPHGSQFQIEVLIFAQLLLITLFHAFFEQLQLFCQHRHRRSISLLRLVDVLVWVLPHAGKPLIPRITPTLLLALCLRHAAYDKRQEQKHFFQSAFGLG